MISVTIKTWESQTTTHEMGGVANYSDTTFTSRCSLSYSTLPGVSANKVKSLPKPTLFPGWYFVPLWRKIIFPARTASPPNFLTPRRLLLLSRPFFEVPCPFLCAILATSLKTLVIWDRSIRFQWPTNVVDVHGVFCIPVFSSFWRQWSSYLSCSRGFWP